MTRPPLTLMLTTALETGIDNTQRPPLLHLLHPVFGRPSTIMTCAIQGRVRRSGAPRRGTPQENPEWDHLSPALAQVIPMPRVIQMRRRSSEYGFQPEHPDNDPTAA